MRPNQMRIGNENPIESKNTIIMHYRGCNILIFQAWQRQQNQIQEVKLLINTRTKYKDSLTHTKQAIGAKARFSFPVSERKLIKSINPAVNRY